ncbi:MULTISPECIES: XkdX family protein [Bacillus]|uniref:XkdX family protein n=1 Tax=Bacillus amyloliquefaciens (strain Y2) TaxID=1155777 RepID=I2C4N9_BACAY|nr:MULTISPECIES: XkdX family protein [Bacillus]AFJ61613.1 hypothetical protein MUS_1608 [Bacillus velezensis YAU B9601-Y2]MCX2884504.1 XkdX family protein [Bacillus velezensis]MEC1247084.1 XkdX family protein [Bacillus amyloliquefaciens]PAC78486.1 XkdX family protein [Bacillus velezensis]QRL08745.1 XkdX family protein [Bacillus velezensis]
MDWFGYIKGFFDKKLWDEEQVYNVVGKRITPEQYEEIVGKPYESNESKGEIK